MGKEDTLDTLPLLLLCGYLSRLQLPLAEVWDCVDDHPRYAATEIDGLCNNKVSLMSEEYEEGTDLVKDKRGNAGRNDRVSDPYVPCHPLRLEPVELGKVYIQASI